MSAGKRQPTSASDRAPVSRIAYDEALVDCQCETNSGKSEWKKSCALEFELLHALLRAVQLQRRHFLDLSSAATRKPRRVTFRSIRPPVS